uniref:Uncharacterized protein n=1 Tax=Helianthus annuus TaxID=4232 RepID=A0A251VQ43_HELAN
MYDSKPPRPSNQTNPYLWRPALMDVKCCSTTTTDKPNSDDYLTTAEDKLCCSIYCCFV